MSAFFPPEACAQPSRRLAPPWEAADPHPCELEPTTLPGPWTRRSATAPAPRTSAPQACWCSASSRAVRTPVATKSWRCWAASYPCVRPTTMSCRRMATGAATSVTRGRQRQTLRLRRKWSGTSPGSLPRLGTGWSAASAQGWWPAWPRSSGTRACRRRTRGGAWRPRWNSSHSSTLRTWTARRPCCC
ncbi:BH3-interacting domain death agonist isoform X4 [Mesoplodon densirostris]|uniref:BH3-interacting domain death agonist isoform X4 n=1 Tax=Mesoplodon densirostris TaxID=48708 RepID=UPI0028DCBD46|nr:BH3-interacting domain death agonist isoform X4 [Mesoplodon densirostris]